jgi:hypothetical protein
MAGIFVGHPTKQICRQRFTVPHYPYCYHCQQISVPTVCILVTKNFFLNTPDASLIQMTIEIMRHLSKEWWAIKDSNL